MTEPPDDLDTWLARDVEPLSPPPGTFERIRGRARRRKRNQVLMASAAAAVVIAGGVLIPAAATGLLTGSDQSAGPAAAARPHSPTPAAPTHTPASTAPATTTTAPAAGAGSALSATTSGVAAPANFQPTSITMISGSVGAVIGQAGTPGHCGPPVAGDCTSLAGTSDYGSSWYGVSAPVTSAPDGGTGVSQLRFLSLTDGWAYGPALYATSDGGRSWTTAPASGLRVTALEAGGDRAFAVLASCQGSSPAYAADCSTFSLYWLAAGTASLQPVSLDIPAAVSAGAMGTAGVPASAAVVIKGDAADPEAGTGYLYAPSGDILSGSVGGGAWTYAGKAPCAPGTAGASGAPTGGQLAVGGSGLLLRCAGGGGSQPGQVWESADGASWTKVSVTGGTGAALSLAATSSGRLVLATTTGLFYAAAGPGAWHAASIAGGTPAGGFSYVGMTSATQGVALPADAALGEVFISRDGGQTWTPRRI